ncbi:MAG: T9SS type A sorting domain-containing protein [Flavobacteriales bacterium]|nr:T9SS type A sorting domain-containing protein [Flavobacteriales bacterium]
MKGLLAIAWVLACMSQIRAQLTIHSESDGDWYEPSTWDCSCIPPNSALVFVDHNVTVTGGMGKSGGSLTVTSTGYMDSFETVQLGCAVDNQGVMVLGDLWIDASALLFENNGYLSCYRVANYRDGLYNSGYWDISDELFLYADLENGTTGYLSASTVSGGAVLENFNVAGFFGADGPAMRIFNHDSLDIHASAGSVVRAIFNTGRLEMTGLTVDTLTNSGSISSSSTHIGKYYSGNGDWFVIPVGQDIFVDAGATMTIIAPGVLNVSNGDLTVNGVLDGNGCVLVAQTTVNNGLITGTIDICDGTPTTAIAPIIDVNTGTVTSGVRYCSPDACTVGIGSSDGSAAIRLFPNPASDRVQLMGIGHGTSIQLVDLYGRSQPIHTRIQHDRVSLDTSEVANGMYVLILQYGRWTATMPLAIMR